jgi:tetratricopeptide (TPR) repeat protein
MLVVAVVITGTVWTWSYFANKKAIKVTGMLSRAMEIYNQSVTAPPSSSPKEGIPQYKTRNAKLVAAESEVSKAVNESSGSLDQLALLMRAGLKYEQGKYAEAIKDYEAFLGENTDAQFGPLALESLGYCYEAQKQFDKALEQFQKLPQDGEQKWMVSYHEARLLAKRGKKSEAIRLYKQIVEKAKSRMILDLASNQLTQLEG